MEDKAQKNNKKAYLDQLSVWDFDVREFAVTVLPRESNAVRARELLLATRRLCGLRCVCALVCVCGSVCVCVCVCARVSV